MALDRQRILGELGSVMKQLQNADCGCLGKIFGSSPQQAPPMGNPLPTCGGCRRSCCCGHGYGNYNRSDTTNHPGKNFSSMPSDDANPCQQPLTGNTFGFGPQIVNMMKGDSKTHNMPGQGAGQLTGPMVIDAPQSPHGKVGIAPVTPPSMMQQQQDQLNPVFMTQGMSGQTSQSLIPQQSYGTESAPNMTPSLQQNNPNMSSMNTWPQQNNVNSASHSMPTKQMNPHGQHAQGIAKFYQMFPGVKQGLGGDLGFDPMAIAIQMNPDNHLQSAMDTMNRIMNDNKGVNKMMNPVTQPGFGENLNIPQNSQVPNTVMQQNLTSNQLPPDTLNQTANPSYSTTQNLTGFTHAIPNQLVSNQLLSSNQLSPTRQTIDKINSNQQNIPNTYGHQQIYQTAIVPPTINQRNIESGGSQQQTGITQQSYLPQQYGQQGITAPNLPVTYEEPNEGSQMQQPPTQSIVYSDDSRPQEMIKEPIFPADSSRDMIHTPSAQRNNYAYNTLGQPVEMLPAKLFHPPEPSLPQTLSPQALVKPRANQLRAVNVKATISKTSLMGNKPVGRTPSRNQLQHIYNQYKGSQSFTQQNVRDPCEVTYSDGRLNVPQANVKKAQPVPVEKVGGDTVVNNQAGEQVRANKIDQVMGQKGDVAAAKPGGDTLPVKEDPLPIKKTRNGLQDVVFSSYPTSTAWTFHGRRDTSPTNRFQSRRY